MRSARRLMAFFSGALLYCSAVGLSWMLLEGWLQLAIRPYFRSYADTQMAAAGGVALLIFVISVGWCFVSLRVPVGSRRPTTAWLVGGIGAASLAWILFGAFALALAPKGKVVTVVSLLFVPTSPPLWGPLNGLAVLAGALLAGMLARRMAPPRHARSSLQTAAA